MDNPAPSARAPRRDIVAAAVAVAGAVLATALIIPLQSLLAGFESTLLPDQGPAWYYWKLPDPDFWSRFTAWGGYILHQLLTWGCIAWGMAWAKRNPGARFGTRLVPPGIAFGVVSVAFVALHMLQTVFFYDGLAQDVPVFTSQASVIVMLVLIFILMNDRRGLFFGKKVPMPAKAVAFVKKWHAYYIAWALVYTFWFHPVTATVAHLAGFLYMYVLFAQGMLMYTRVHVSTRWVVVLEAFVLVHGTTVALMQGTPMWTMFAFGFGFLFVVTQMYGLRLPRWANVAVTVVFAAAAVAVYSGAFVPGKSIGQIHQVLWIPLIEYLLVPVFLGLAWGLARVVELVRPRERA